jgi:hypothetical protein
VTVTGSAFAGRPEQVLAWLETLEAPFQAVYEAGPTGYGLSRRAAERGLDVQVCSPGHIARRARDRIKPTGVTPSGSRGCCSPTS